jgi:hypothetical protein
LAAACATLVSDCRRRSARVATRLTLSRLHGRQLPEHVEHSRVDGERGSAGAARRGTVVGAHASQPTSVVQQRGLAQQPPARQTAQRATPARSTRSEEGAVGGCHPLAPSDP